MAAMGKDTTEVETGEALSRGLAEPVVGSGAISAAAGGGMAHEHARTGLSQDKLSLDLAGRISTPKRDFCAFRGQVYRGHFRLSVRCKIVADSRKVENFVRAVLASHKAISNPFKELNEGQLQKMAKFSKIMDRMASSHPGERANAAHILAGKLKEANLDMSAFKDAHSSLDIGIDANAMTLICVQHPSWRRVRDWFQELANAISQPLGLAVGTTAASESWADGCCIVGSLPATVVAACILTHLADSAMEQAEVEKGHLNDHYFKYKVQNDFCRGYTTQATSYFTEVGDDESADAAAMRAFSAQCQVAFGWSSWGDVPSTESCGTSSTALEGKSSAEKRRTQFEDSAEKLKRQRVHALGGA
jgi:hypothetical protein